LLGVASFYLLVLIAGLILRYLHVLLLSIIGQRIMFDMRSQMFDHLQRLSLAYFDHNPVGRLMTRLTNDVDSLNEMFTSGAISILGDALTILGITILLLVINWQLALVTFVVMPRSSGLLPTSALPCAIISVPFACALRVSTPI